MTFVWASEMSQQAKVLATETDSLSLTPEPACEKTYAPVSCPSDLHMCMCTPIHTNVTLQTWPKQRTEDIEISKWPGSGGTHL